MMMKAGILVAFGAIALCGAENQVLRGLAPKNKVNICHLPPGNPENFQTISISSNALQTHLNHGDLQGTCNEHCDELCGDGNACTIDFDEVLGCEGVGCILPEERPALDCTTEDKCLDGYCDPATGCIFTDVDCAVEDLCMFGYCDSTVGCLQDPVVCEDYDICTIDSCDSMFGCLFTPVVCTTEDKCLEGHCDPAIGCVFEDISCDVNDLCITSSCDSNIGCIHEEVVCDDQDLCTIDTCSSTQGCVFAPVTCGTGEVCDVSTGQCALIEEVVPCVAVIDEWNPTSQATVDARWATFRQLYPKRPFCLLIPDESSYLPEYNTPPAGYMNDDYSPDTIDRTIHAIVNRDGGNPSAASDWFSLCNLGQYTTSTSSINFVGLFVDTSGSMTLSTVQASYNKFLSDLSMYGLTYQQVFNGDENFVLPFQTTLAPP